jgi:CBS-domain-containing membrane protein
MIEKVVTIEPSATIRQAAELMNLHEIGCVLVIDHEKPVGILTERDMLKRIICESRSPNTTKVIDMMTKPLVTASPEMRAGDAAKLMFERNIKKLPLAENGRLVGLVTLTDLLRSPGVLDFLNKLALDGTSKRLKNAANLYYDPKGLRRRTCPLNMKDGFSTGCQNVKCMWWDDNECAVTKISRQLPVQETLETSATEQVSVED